MIFNVSKMTEEEERLYSQIRSKEDKITELQKQVKEDKLSLVNLYISPLKLGDTVKCSVDGKDCVGILEADTAFYYKSGISLYIRPYKKNGELSLIHRYIPTSCYHTIEKIDNKEIK